MSVLRAPIRVLSADDHPLLREGVASLLSGQPDLKLVAEVSNGRGAAQLFRVHRPDVTLMDLQMPEMNGVDAMLAIRKDFPSARIIMLTTYAGDAQVLRKELPDTIRLVHTDHKRIAPGVALDKLSAKRSHARRHHRSETRIHRARTIPSKEGCPAGPFGAGGLRP